MVSIEGKDPNEPWGFIICRQENKVPSGTRLVGDGFDTVG